MHEITNVVPYAVSTHTRLHLGPTVQIYCLRTLMDWLTDWLTAWSTVLPEKLICLQIIKNFLHFAEIKRSLPHLRQMPLVPILSQIKTTHIHQPCFFNIYCNIILPSMPRFSTGSTLLVSQPKPCTHFSPSPYMPHAPRASFSLIWSHHYAVFSTILLPPQHPIVTDLQPIFFL